MAAPTDLILSTAGGVDAPAGAPGRQSFQVANEGFGTANGVTFEGTLPPGLEYVGATTPAGISCSYTAVTRKVACLLGTVAPQARPRFDLLLQATTAGTYEVTFRVPYAEETSPEDNEAILQFEIPPAGTAETGAFGWPQNSSPVQGVPFRYWIAAYNWGPATASGMTAAMTIPSSVTFLSAETAGGTCGGLVSGVVTCTLAPVPPDDTRSVSVVVTPKVAGYLGEFRTTTHYAGDPMGDGFTSFDATAGAAVTGAPSASMPGAQIVTDPATGWLDVVTTPDAVGPLTLGGTAQCPGGAPIGSNPVGFRHASVTYPAALSAGRYQATVPADEVDESWFLGSVECGGVTTMQPLGEVTKFRPFGQVTDLATGLPVAGATVTFFRLPGWWPRTGAYQNGVAGSCESEQSKPAGAPWSQVAPAGSGVAVAWQGTIVSPAANPESTNATGRFGWTFERAGCWYVVVSKAGYQPLTSSVFGLTLDDPFAELDPVDLKLAPVVLVSPPPPPPPPDTQAPTLRLTVATAARKRAAVLRSGLVATLRTSEACTATIELRLTAALARKLKLPVVIGSAKKTYTAAGTAKVAVKLKPVAKRKLAKLASLRATLIATGKDPAGNTRKVSVTLVIRR